MTGGRPDDDVGTLSRYSPVFWALAVALYGVGDLVTTLIGLRSGRAAEAGVIASVLVESYGIVAVVPLKLGSLLLFYLLWRAIPEPRAIGVPLGLTIVGLLLTAWNAMVLLGLAGVIP